MNKGILNAEDAETQRSKDQLEEVMETLFLLQATVSKKAMGDAGFPGRIFLEPTPLQMKTLEGRRTDRVFWRFRAEGRSYRQIAEMTGLSITTARNKVERHEWLMTRNIK